MTKLPTGRGMYIWQVSQCEGGDIDKIVAVCVSSGLGHVLIKIADGKNPYNTTANLPVLVSKLRAAGVEAWGWQYVYLIDPVKEADVAARRVKELGLDGFVIDAEYECKNKPGKAEEYAEWLRSWLPGVSIGLSSYRFISYHRDFPWASFRAFVDFDMPQVYWEGAHNPAQQLAKSYSEFRALSPKLPYIPTGAAYKWAGWTAAPLDITQFITACGSFSLPAFNFWSWQHARALPLLWAAITGNAPVTWKVRITTPIGLRIRGGPGTSYPRVGGLAFLSVVSVDLQENNWARLTDGRGWICTDWTVRV